MKLLAESTVRALIVRYAEHKPQAYRFLQVLRGETQSLDEEAEEAMTTVATPDTPEV